MDAETDDDFYHDKEEIQDDADDKSTVDLFQVDRVMMVTKAVGLIVVVIVVSVGVIVAGFGCVVMGVVHK